METGKLNTEPDKWIGFSAGDSRQAEQGQGVEGEQVPGEQCGRTGSCGLWGIAHGVWRSLQLSQRKKRHEVRNKVPPSYLVLTPYPMGSVHIPSKGSRGHPQSLSLALDSHSL